jgi:hypothetical protein
MKIGKIGLTLSIFSLLFFSIGVSIYSRAYLNTAVHQIEWKVEEGDTFTWIVKKTSDNFNLLPVNSKYVLTIDSISINNTFYPDIISTYINATLTKYNSGDKSTTVLLDNSQYLSFTETLYGNYSSMPSFTYDQGFIIPATPSSLGFLEGFVDVVESNYSFTMYAISLGTEGYPRFSAYNFTIDLRCSWEFNENFITEKLTFYNITNISNPEILYELVLAGGTTGGSISFGFFLFVPIGVILVTMIYLTKKNLKSSKIRE